MRSQGTSTPYGRERSATQYDSLKVESLKRTLRRAMRHASNVRQLGPDERIIAVALESPKSREATMRVQIQMSGQYGGYKAVSPARSRPTNVISVRTTKKQIDALAQGQIDVATFDASVQILSYPLPLLQSNDNSYSRP